MGLLYLSIGCRCAFMAFMGPLDDYGRCKYWNGFREGPMDVIRSDQSRFLRSSL